MVDYVEGTNKISLWIELRLLGEIVANYRMLEMKDSALKVKMIVVQGDQDDTAGQSKCMVVNKKMFNNLFLNTSKNFYKLLYVV